jgi:hypothetical protein
VDPKPANAVLVGGVVSNHGGHKLAHFVYKHGDKLIYMYQAPEGLFTSRDLQLTSNIARPVIDGEWYWEKQNAGTLVIWEAQKTVCSIVSDLDQEQLAAVLSPQIGESTQ